MARIISFSRGVKCACSPSLELDTLTQLLRRTERLPAEGKRASSPARPATTRSAPPTS